MKLFPNFTSIPFDYTYLLLLSSSSSPLLLLLVPVASGASGGCLATSTSVNIAIYYFVEEQGNTRDCVGEYHL